MDYLTLSNGVQMPMIGFGTWDLRGEECEEALQQALAVGYRLIDTAKMYGNEKDIGKVLKKTTLPRAELFITSKLNSPYTSYHKAKAGIEESLKDLQLDYLDLLLIHEPYEASLDMYRALEEAYQEGKVKAIGVSNFHEAFYQEFIKTCHTIPMINQVESHIFFQQLDLQDTMRDYGTIMEAWSPLAAAKENIFENVVLLEIAKGYHKSVAQVALRYLTQQGIIIIPKSSHVERMKENINIFDFMLSKEDMNQIKLLDKKKSLFGWYD